MKPELYIDLLLCIQKRAKEYDKINKALRELNPNFPAYVQCIDEDILVSAVAALDDAFLTLTGYPELASYYLWDNPKQGIIHENCIHLAKGNIYMWDSPETFKATIYEMIKDKA